MKFKKLLSLFFIILAITLNPFVIEFFFGLNHRISLFANYFIITFVQIFLFLIAIVIFKNGFYKSLRTIQRKDFFVLFVSILLFLIIVETLMHLFLPPIHMIEINNNYPLEKVSHKRIVENNLNLFRNVKNDYFNYGFKRWGNLSSDKSRILIIGDSFTEMVTVNNGEEWYSYLEKNLTGYDFFVYGQGAFGTMQEYIIINDFYDIINPDFIILQFCQNDFSDNYYKWDKRLFPYSFPGYRPYLVNDEIVYKLPVPFAKLRYYSRFVDYILNMYDRIIIIFYENNLLSRPEWESIIKNDKEYVEAMNTTTKIIRKIVKRTENSEVFLFNACKTYPDNEEMFFSQFNLTFIPKIPEKIGEICFLKDVNCHVINDGHHNLVGNKVLGEYLVGYFNDNNLINLN